MSSQASQASSGSKGVDLASLSSQQLKQVKRQLDDELEHLNSSYTQLRGAQSKFNECIRSIDEGVTARPQGAPILVPLTSSLYVPGALASTDTVIVDVGTGFYVEKSRDDANTFYKDKVKELGANLKELEGIMQGKANNLRGVEEVLKQKLSQEQQSGSQQAAVSR